MKDNIPISIELPETFWEEEDREGCWVSKEKKEIWAVELDLLAQFMSVCDRYGIKYFMDGGTMLGAVRHKGFIPWDDDIDVVMKREEYDRLCEVASAEFKHPYFWQTEETDPGSLRGHAQLRNSMTTGILEGEKEGKWNFNQGIFIDIFPMDHIPENNFIRKLFLFEVEKRFVCMRKVVNVTSRYLPNKKGLKGFVKILLHILLNNRVSVMRMYKKIEQLMKKYNLKKTKLIGKLFFQPIKSNYVWEDRWFDAFQKMPFETLQVPVSVHYDQIMGKFYGDWRTPIRQETTHGGVIFDVHRSYVEYFEECEEQR